MFAVQTIFRGVMGMDRSHTGSYGALEGSITHCDVTRIFEMMEFK
jgi:hypothetical protein